MFDANVLLRASSAGALSASETGATGVDMGVDLEPQTYGVYVPSVSGTSATLDVVIQESDDNATWRDFLVFPQIVQASAPGQYFATGKSNARYRRYKATLGGTTPNFGTVLIGPMPAGRYTNW